MSDADLLCRCLNATVINRDYITQCERLAGDTEKDERTAARCCRVCYYMRDRVGGAMMTCTVCDACRTTMVFGNTCVDVLCHQCSIELSLCRHCGADMDDKHRNKLRRKGAK